MTKDYLAIIMVGPGGSSFARGSDLEDTINRAVKIAHEDWSKLFDLSGKKVSVNVFDVTGYEDLYWDDRGVFECSADERGAHDASKDQPIPRLDLVERTFPQ